MTQTQRFDDANVLIYSHDSFGLGHLRRCREIAHSLVEHYKGMRVLILSGSPIIGSFDFRARVDFVRIPSVVKLRNGDYTSLNSHIDIQQTLAIRAAIIKQTAEVYKPDLFIVDKEPLGLRGEVRETLESFRNSKTHVVLGLRDIMDDPDALQKEWKRRDVAASLDRYFDEVWVYGHPLMGNPLDGVGLAEDTMSRLKFSGYIMRHVPTTVNTITPLPEQPYILVTTGGGGDGTEMVDWVLRAYECGQPMPYHGLFVLGPFMPLKDRNRFVERIEKLDNVSVRVFSANMERLMENAACVVCMGGYNTFCEVMSFDKRALLVPRSKPRREQLIRAERAHELGLLSYVDGDGDRDTDVMVEAMRRLPQQPLPSQAGIDRMLHGLESINRWVYDLVIDKHSKSDSAITDVAEA
jgi:predicted glycosyltransferase